jgi:hypothetical protein
MIPTPTPNISVTINMPTFQNYFDWGFDTLAISLLIAFSVIFFGKKIIEKIFAALR